MILTKFHQLQVKNITYCKYKFLSYRILILKLIESRSDLAKISPHILNPERFALHLATFLVSKYAHISKAFVTIEQLRWTRIRIKDDNAHPHSFHRDGNDKRVVKVEVSNFDRFYVDHLLRRHIA